MRISKKIATAAAALALAAGMLAPTASAACPYTVGPLGRYIAPAIVKGMTATDENQIEVWCSGADCCAFAPFRANRDTIPTCVIFIACFFVRF